MSGGTEARCVGLVGWLLGHRFEGRYSEERQTFGYNRPAAGPFDPIPFLKVTTRAEGAIRPDLLKRTYHGDVCVRCGRSVGGTRA